MDKQDQSPYLPERRKAADVSRDKQRQYEYLKSMLPIDLTSLEYEAACQRIARELGI